MLNEMSAILEDLKNPNSEIRELALDKIGTLKPNNSLEIILPFLSDSDPGVRSTAACNLGEIQDICAIPHLINIVKNDNDEEVRADALSALGEYQSPEILNCLIDEVNRDKRSRRPRQEVARQLKHYNTEEAVDALIELLQDEDDYVKIPAVDSLLELNRPSLRQIWIDALDSENCYVSEIATKALANLDLLVLQES
jgi:HEAT repeat protein